MGEKTDKVVSKDVSYNWWHYMGTTNLGSSLEKRIIQFVASHWDKNSECSLEVRLIQFEASYGDNKLRRHSRGASHIIGYSVWGQQTQKVV